MGARFRRVAKASRNVPVVATVSDWAWTATVSHGMPSMSDCEIFSAFCMRPIHCVASRRPGTHVGLPGDHAQIGQGRASGCFLFCSQSRSVPIGTWYRAANSAYEMPSCWRSERAMAAAVSASPRSGAASGLGATLRATSSSVWA